MVTGLSGPMRMPVGAFLVEHPKGTLVFDTGMHPEVLRSKARLRSLGELFEVELDEDGTVAGQLAALDVDADAVDLAFCSHLHFDHAGGLALLPNARVVVQAREWRAGFKERLVEAGLYNPDDFDLGHERHELDGEVDLFGDGSVVALPTAGHTPGHQSLLVEGRLLLAGDACYCRYALDHDATPAFGYDLDAMRVVYADLRAREAAGVHLVFSHDEQQWATLHGEL
jgi:glyoxylase-like metal-dependent hydrolase (beta-lactamase superfamily II)